MRDQVDWPHFKAVAFPAEQARAESERSALWKVNRWLGLRFAYVFFRLGFSANGVSFLRLGMVATAFWTLSWRSAEASLLPLLGAFLLVAQVTLDYADGPIARATGMSSPLGQKLDGLANDMARFGLLVLCGSQLSSSVALIMVALAAYSVLVFVPGSGVGYRRGGAWRPLDFFYRMALFVPVMVCVWPIVWAVWRAMGWDLHALSSVVCSLYASLAVLWFPVYWRPTTSTAQGV